MERLGHHHFYFNRDSISVSCDDGQGNAEVGVKVNKMKNDRGEGDKSFYRDESNCVRF